MEQLTYKVSELNDHIRGVLTGGFPDVIWLCGEIQGYDRNRDKSHIFFELVEKESNSATIVARIGLVIFSGKKFQLQSILKKAETPFDLKDDIEVRFACKVDFYAPHGAVRLIVESIDPVYTLGKLAQDRLKLIAELKAKGILERNKRLELPAVPLNVGLITAYDSAAYNDFLSELKRSGLGFKIHLRNTVMQGKATETDVPEAIRQLSTIPDLDVIVITRGGGSIADLACFDARSIAEAIAASRLPVLTGIGHEINTSVADLTAHSFFKTPTAAAQFLAGRVQEFCDYLDDQKENLLNIVHEQIRHGKDTLKTSAMRLQTGTMSYLRDHREHMIRLIQTVQTRPAIVLKEKFRILKALRQEIEPAVVKRLDLERKQVQHFQKMVELASPAKTLKRGFSITRGSDGKVIKKLADVIKGDMMTTEFVDGKAVSEVKDTQK